MRIDKLVLSLPGWVSDFLDEAGEVFVGTEKRMRLVIELARLNVRHETGGPFAAAVFECDSGRLVAVGVNRVMPENCSIGHAEMLALALAQKAVGQYDLAAEGMAAHELVNSTEPCAMCLGAIPWSGVRRLVCGARDEDARAVGFDEGDKPNNWVQCLQRRGVEVVREVLREEATKVLREYSETSGVIYNSRASRPS